MCVSDCVCVCVSQTLSDVVPDVQLQLLHTLVHLSRELLLFIAVDDGDHCGTSPNNQTEP